MKFLLLFLLVGCQDKPERKYEDASGLIVYRHEANKVTCYRVILMEGISCVRDEK